MLWLGAVSDYYCGVRLALQYILKNRVVEETPELGQERPGSCMYPDMATVMLFRVLVRLQSVACSLYAGRFGKYGCCCHVGGDFACMSGRRFWDVCYGCT